MKKIYLSIVGMFMCAAPLLAQVTCQAPFTTQTFTYSGGIQTFMVPSGVTQIYVEAFGAAGGSGATGGNAATGGAGGFGGKVTGYLTVTPGQVYNILVGGQGATPAGGFNGGGNGGSTNAGGGGGATDIRFPGTTPGDRIFVAGGGGGGGRAGCETNTVAGGNGGASGTNGSNGTDAPTPGGVAGAGFGGLTAGGGGAAGIGCGGFLGAPGGANNVEVGGNGGAGQSCCCFSFPSIPGGGGGGGGFNGGGAGGGGSAGTTGCSGNDKGSGGGGAGGANFVGAFTSTNIVMSDNGGNGYINICYCLPPDMPVLSAPNTTICLGASVQMTATGNLNGGSHWYWYTGSCGGTLIDTGASITVMPNTNTTYYVRGEGGCSGPCEMINITVSSAVPVIVANGPTTFCQGDSVILDAGSFSSYVWNTGATSQTIKADTSGTYVVTVTNSDGCSGTTNATVVVNALPVVIIQGTSTICYGDSTVLTANGAGGSHLWNNGKTTQSITVAPIANTTYSVVFTDANGCKGSDSQLVTVNPQINVATTTLGLTITATQAGATYQWINCPANTAIAGATNQSYTVTGNGQYAVIITMNGCSDTSACVAITNVGIEGLALTDGQVDVYPNPSNGQFVIEIAAFGNSSTRVQVTDELGKVVFTENVQLQAGSNKVRVDLTNKAKGNYLVQISGSQGLVTKKVSVK